MEETTKIDTGGPAFPQTHKLMNKGFPDMVVPETTGGLSIRDYFAAKAMRGFIAANDKIGNEHAPHVACCAYFYADEMLKARSARTTPAGGSDE